MRVLAFKTIQKILLRLDPALRPDFPVTDIVLEVVRDGEKVARKFGFVDCAISFREIWLVDGPALDRIDSESSTRQQRQKVESEAALGLLTQMDFLSDDLLRPLGVDDKRVNFPVDQWQQRLLDCVDSRDSMLVVAPTSAGKFVLFFPVSISFTIGLTMFQGKHLPAFMRCSEFSKNPTMGFSFMSLQRNLS